MKSYLSALVFGTLIVSACSQQPESAAENTGSAVAETVAASAAQQVLQSENGLISIKTEGTFADKRGDRELLPQGVNADQILLLQHDDNTDTTIYAAQTGELKSAPDTYFKQLKTALQADKSLQNLQIGAATANRMAYRYTQVLGEDNVYHESCLAVIGGKTLYTVCAGSPETDVEQLGQILRDVTVSQDKL